MTLDPRRQAVVDAAAAEIGPGDKPKYWVSCGAAPDTDKAWCGAFTLYCLHQAGLALGVKWIFGIGYAEVQHLARTRNPQPGDVMYKDQPWQHYGVVESWDGQTLVTIEGNTPTVAREVHTDLTGLAFYSIDRFLGVQAPVAPPSASVPAPPTFYADYLRGIDVSHHQIPSAINWTRLAQTFKFCIVRASYGTKLDEQFAEHVQRAKDVGLVVGGYGFFRAGQDASDQLDALLSALDAVGYGPGWVPPALDVEQNTAFDGVVSPDRYAPCEQLCSGIADHYGSAMVYTNPSMWAEIGSPGWLKDYLLWISHYGVQKPTTPLGMPWAIWQKAVAAIPGIAPGPLDQNIARVVPVLRAPEQPGLLPLELDWEQLRADRDALVAESS